MPLKKYREDSKVQTFIVSLIIIFWYSTSLSRSSIVASIVGARRLFQSRMHAWMSRRSVEHRIISQVLDIRDGLFATAAAAKHGSKTSRIMISSKLSLFLSVCPSDRIVMVDWRIQFESRRLSVFLVLYKFSFNSIQPV